MSARASAVAPPLVPGRLSAACVLRCDSRAVSRRSPRSSPAAGLYRRCSLPSGSTPARRASYHAPLQIGLTPRVPPRWSGVVQLVRPIGQNKTKDDLWILLLRPTLPAFRARTRGSFPADDNASHRPRACRPQPMIYLPDEITNPAVHLLQRLHQRRLTLRPPAYHRPKKWRVVARSFAPPLKAEHSSNPMSLPGFAVEAELFDCRW